MRYDLEGELLRAIAALSGDTGAAELSAVRDLIAGAPRQFPRLADRRLAWLVDGLAERLVADGILVRTGASYAPSAQARAELERAPAVLTSATADVPDHDITDDDITDDDITDDDIAADDIAADDIAADDNIPDVPDHGIVDEPVTDPAIELG